MPSKHSSKKKEKIIPRIFSSCSPNCVINDEPKNELAHNTKVTQKEEEKKGILNVEGQRQSIEKVNNHYRPDMAGKSETRKPPAHSPISSCVGKANRSAKSHCRSPLLNYSHPMTSRTFCTCSDTSNNNNTNSNSAHHHHHSQEQQQHDSTLQECASTLSMMRRRGKTEQSSNSDDDDNVMDGPGTVGGKKEMVPDRLRDSGGSFPRPLAAFSFSENVISFFFGALLSWDVHPFVMSNGDSAERKLFKFLRHYYFYQLMQGNLHEEEEELEGNSRRMGEGERKIVPSVLRSRNSRGIDKTEEEDVTQILTRKENEPYRTNSFFDTAFSASPSSFPFSWTQPLFGKGEAGDSVEEDAAGEEEKRGNITNNHNIKRRSGTTSMRTEVRGKAQPVVNHVHQVCNSIRRCLLFDTHSFQESFVSEDKKLETSFSFPSAHEKHNKEEGKEGKQKTEEKLLQTGENKKPKGTDVLHMEHLQREEEEEEIAYHRNDISSSLYSFLLFNHVSNPFMQVIFRLSSPSSFPSLSPLPPAAYLLGEIDFTSGSILPSSFPSTATTSPQTLGNTTALPFEDSFFSRCCFSATMSSSCTSSSKSSSTGSTHRALSSAEVLAMLSNFGAREEWDTRGKKGESASEDTSISPPQLHSHRVLLFDLTLPAQFSFLRNKRENNKEGESLMSALTEEQEELSPPAALQPQGQTVKGIIPLSTKNKDKKKVASMESLYPSPLSPPSSFTASSSSMNACGMEYRGGGIQEEDDEEEDDFLWKHMERWEREGQPHSLLKKKKMEEEAEKRNEKTLVESKTLKKDHLHHNRCQQKPQQQQQQNKHSFCLSTAEFQSGEKIPENSSSNNNINNNNKDVHDIRVVECTPQQGTRWARSRLGKRENATKETLNTTPSSTGTTTARLSNTGRKMILKQEQGGEDLVSSTPSPTTPSCAASSSPQRQKSSAESPLLHTSPTTAVTTTTAVSVLSSPLLSTSVSSLSSSATTVLKLKHLSGFEVSAAASSCSLAHTRHLLRWYGQKAEEEEKAAAAARTKAADYHHHHHALFPLAHCHSHHIPLNPLSTSSSSSSSSALFPPGSRKRQREDISCSSCSSSLPEEQSSPFPAVEGRKGEEKKEVDEEEGNQPSEQKEKTEEKVDEGEIARDSINKLHASIRYYFHHPQHYQQTVRDEMWKDIQLASRAVLELQRVHQERRRWGESNPSINYVHERENSHNNSDEEEEEEEEMDATADDEVDLSDLFDAPLGVLQIADVLHVVVQTQLEARAEERRYDGASCYASSSSGVPASPCTSFPRIPPRAFLTTGGKLSSWRHHLSPSSPSRSPPSLLHSWRELHETEMFSSLRLPVLMDVPYRGSLLPAPVTTTPVPLPRSLSSSSFPAPPLFQNVGEPPSTTSFALLQPSPLMGCYHTLSRMPESCPEKRFTETSSVLDHHCGDSNIAHNNNNNTSRNANNDSRRSSILSGCYWSRTNTSTMHLWADGPQITLTPSLSSVKNGVEVKEREENEDGNRVVPHPTSSHYLSDACFVSVQKNPANDLRFLVHRRYMPKSMRESVDRDCTTTAARKKEGYELKPPGSSSSFEDGSSSPFSPLASHTSMLKKERNEEEEEKNDDDDDEKKGEKTFNPTRKRRNLKKEVGWKDHEEGSVSFSRGSASLDLGGRDASTCSTSNQERGKDHDTEALSDSTKSKGRPSQLLPSPAIPPIPMPDVEWLYS